MRRCSCCRSGGPACCGARRMCGWRRCWWRVIVTTGRWSTRWLVWCRRLRCSMRWVGCAPVAMWSMGMCRLIGLGGGVRSVSIRMTPSDASPRRRWRWSRSVTASTPPRSSTACDGWASPRRRRRGRGDAVWLWSPTIICSRPSPRSTRLRWRRDGRGSSCGPAAVSCGWVRTSGPVTVRVGRVWRSVCAPTVTSSATSPPATTARVMSRVRRRWGWCRRSPPTPRRPSSRWRSPKSSPARRATSTTSWSRSIG